MLFLKLKPDNKLYLYIFSFSLLLLFGCCSGKKVIYGIDIMQPELRSMKASIHRFNVPYSSVVTPYWDNAVTKGFLSSTNLENFDPLANNSLERGLGYIFFNTLRARLSNERGVSHRNLQIWKGGINNVTGFVCPKPWKYEIRRISGREYGCFYLDCVQMGEYFYDDNGDSIRNYDKIRNQRRVPYMKVYYTDGNQEMSNDFVLNIDHLLQDDTYLVELPKVLHDLKTDYLDPFITFQTQTSRNLPPITYWKNRADYLNVNDNNINECKCLGRFLPPTAAGNIIDHTHDDNNNNQYWKTNWTAKMMRDNVVLPRR